MRCKDYPALKEVSIYNTHNQSAVYAFMLRTEANVQWMFKDKKKFKDELMSINAAIY